MMNSAKFVDIDEREYLFLNFYRLAVVFLAFDVFFAIFCVILACLIGIALCCCLPCIIAILYAVAGQVRIKNFRLIGKFQTCSVF